MKTLWELFNAQALSQYWTDVNAHMGDPFLGTQLFPASKRTGLDLRWIKGKNDLPVALEPSAFDAKASVRDRIGFTVVDSSMPFFREASVLDEQTRQEIQTLLASGERFAEPLIQRVFDDASRLIDGANVQAERMRMSLISSGTIGITGNNKEGRNVSYNINYDPNGSWGSTNVVTLAGSDQWTLANKATSNPLKDLNDAIIYMKSTLGVTPTRAVMNSVTFNNLIATESILKALNPVGYPNEFKSLAQLKQFVEGITGLTITLYDKMYASTVNGSTVQAKYFPDNVVTLLPSYALGNTWYGTTPEEFDLRSGSDGLVQTSVVNTGVAVTTIKEPHPVNIKTVVSEIVMPSFERMSDIYIINVA